MKDLKLWRTICLILFILFALLALGTHLYNSVEADRWCIFFRIVYVQFLIQRITLNVIKNVMEEAKQDAV